MAKHHTTEPGYIAERHNHAIGHHAGRKKIVIYDSDTIGFEWPDELKLVDPVGRRYAVICKTHNTGTTQSSLPAARGSMKLPAAWCDKCRALVPRPDAPPGARELGERLDAATPAVMPASSPSTPAIIAAPWPAQYVHIPSLLASLAIDPALAPDVMRIVERHCNDLDNQ